MDWIQFQHAIRPHLYIYFRDRSLTPTRIENAKSKDIGEQAKKIDELIPVIWRKNELPPMSELEKDILAIRLEWADTFSKMDARTWPIGDKLTESGFVYFLTDHWQNVGRAKYKNLSKRFRDDLEKLSNKRE
jgi:hypothetical protein